MHTSHLPHLPQRANQVPIRQSRPEAREILTREQLDTLHAHKANGDAVAHLGEGGGLPVGAVDGEEGEGVRVCEADLWCQCQLERDEAGKRDGTVATTSASLATSTRTE